MQAVAFVQTGGPEVLRILDLWGSDSPKLASLAWIAYSQPDVWARGVANLVPLIASGAVDPYITGVYTREQAPEAHRLLEGRLSQGKLALVHPN